MAKLLSNLKIIKIDECDGIEEVVSNRDVEDEEKTTFASTSSHTTTTLFPRIDSLTLNRLLNLNFIGGGRGRAFVDQFKFSEAGGVSWSLCQYAREISIGECDKLSSVIPCYAAGKMQKLQVLTVKRCKGMKEVFETDGGMKKKKKSGSGCDEGSGIPRLYNIIMLPNLKILKIWFCQSLEHVFTFSALESLRQLEELTIQGCSGMKVIVKKEEEDGDGEKQTKTSSKVVVFPRLNSIELHRLPELEGFFLGKNHEFRWPSLDYVMIKYCPKMTTFAPGGSTAPQLKYMHTGLGKHSLGECGLNFHVTTPAHQQTPLFPTSYLATSEGMPWSFHNLIKLDVDVNYDFEKVVPSNELLQLQKLEKIHVMWCRSAEEVFEALEAAWTNDESQTTIVRLPNLKQVKLEGLDGLRYIWKSNQWTVFEFPNLTTLSIYDCGSLQYVFTSSMVGSLLQLQELHICECGHLEEVIAKDADVEELEEESDAKIKEMMLPRLKSLTLKDLPCFKRFCLEKVYFSFPLLDTLIIHGCQKITTFTKGNISTPELREIETSFGSLYAAGEDINSIINIKQEEFGTERPS